MSASTLECGVKCGLIRVYHESRVVSVGKMVPGSPPLPPKDMALLPPSEAVPSSVSPRTGGHRRARHIVLAILLSLSLLAGAGWVYFHWNDPDKEYKIVNFSAAWFPFAVSIFAAFIPDLEKVGKMRRVWRIGIIVAGFLYSIVLWHQQSVNLAASRRDQEGIVTTAVSKSNDHADQQISGIRKDVSAVRGDFAKANDQSGRQISKMEDELKGAFGSVATLVSKTETNLNASIGKVGKPEPPDLASLQFGLWEENSSTAGPILTSSLRPDKDGVFTVAFWLTNNSNTAMHSVDVWIDICDHCMFTQEPAGFERPTGMRDQTRHVRISLLNPGVGTEKGILHIKPARPFTQFEVAMRYSCEVCVKMAPPQKATIIALPQAP